MPARNLVLAAAVCWCLLGQGAAAAGQEAKPGKPRYQVAFSTFLGGSADEQLREVIVCKDGSLLVGGQTNSPDLPITPGVFQPKYGGEPAGTGHPGLVGGDCFLARVSGDGKKLLGATYFGGSKQERNVYGMAVDANEDIVITSATRSDDMPTTEGAFQRKYAGGASDIVVAKLSRDFTRLLWCTYIGGSGDESPRGGLGTDKDGFIYIVGTTDSKDFPTTPGAFQERPKGQHDGLIVKLKPDGSGLVFSTLLGGSDSDGIMGARIDGAGNVLVAGHTTSTDLPVTADAFQPKLAGKSDCFFAGLSADGKRLLYSTYLGGQENEFAEHRPALLADGGFLLTGVTGSKGFPTTERAYQRAIKGTTGGFLARLSADRKKLDFSTVLEGSGGGFLLMPTPDANGNIIVVGQTSSRDYPVTPDAIQPNYGGGQSDGVLAILSPDGKDLLYATYLGGSGEDLIRGLTIGPAGEIYIVGSTSSKDFPVTKGSFQTEMKGAADGFIVKLGPPR
jgi:hypothetical protein